MIRAWVGAAAITALSLVAGGSWAATFTQTNTVIPGQIALIEVDLEFPDAGFELGGWQLGLSPAPLTGFIGIQDIEDGPADPSRSPVYQALAGSPVGASVFGPSAGSLITSALLSRFTIVATSRNLPDDNLSRFTLAFLTSSALPTDASYDISYSLGMAVRDTATGDVNNSAFLETGTFKLTIGAPAVVPLPASGALLATGLVVGWGLRKRRRAI